MSHFRSRAIRVKYEKLKKKQQDFYKDQRKRNFRKKNWLLANAIIDFDLLEKPLAIQGQTMYSYMRSCFSLNSHPFFDATFKLDLIYQRFFTVATQIQPQTIRLASGFLFYTNKLTIIYKILSFIASFVSFQVFSKHNGFFVLIKTIEVNPFCSVVLLEKSFSEQKDSFFLLGFFFNKNLYTINQLFFFLFSYGVFFHFLLGKEKLEEFLDESEKVFKEMTEVLLRRDPEKDIGSLSLLKIYEQKDMVLFKQSPFYIHLNTVKSKILVLSKNKKQKKKFVFFLLDDFCAFTDCSFFSFYFIF